MEKIIIIISVWTFLILLINISAFVALVVYFFEKNSKNEKIRFREFVKANLSANVQEYSEIVEEETSELPKNDDELVDLETIEEDKLLKKLKEEYED